MRRLELRRAGNELILLSDWKSDWLAAHAHRICEREEREAAERRAWGDGDELLQLIERQHGAESDSLSLSYPSRAMRSDGDPNPCYIEADIKPQEHSGDDRAARLRWGVEEGPITLELTDRRSRTFERSELPCAPEGLERGWAAARHHMIGKRP